MKLSRYLIGTTVGASSLALAPVAMGQQGTSSGQPGTTMGPASGTPVQPSTAVQKQNPSAPAAPETAQGSTAAGAPAHLAGQERRLVAPPGSAPGSVSSDAAQGGVGAGSPGVPAQPGTQGGASPGTGSK